MGLSPCSSRFSDRLEIDRAKKMEEERNVDEAVRLFIETLVVSHKIIDTGDEVRSTRGELNQVTAGQVKASIEDAYEKANLREFARLAHQHDG